MIENKLAEYVSGLTFEGLDADMLHIIKRNLLDSYAGILGSLRDTAMIEKFDRMSSMLPDEKGISVWGTGKKAYSPEAIFMNTILGRRSDLVNTYMSPNKMGAAHPSDNVSLVLSMADRYGKTGKDLLLYTFAGYQLCGIFSNYYYPEGNGYDHDSAALFYTPLVTGLILGAQEDELIEAQRIAGMMGLDINQSVMGEVTDWKHCTYSSCAMRGLQSVVMALSGFEGAKDIYGGAAGVDRFFPHAEVIMEPLPDLASVVFKKWPALVFCQTPIDVAVDLAGKIDDAGEIEKVEVYTYKMAIDVAAGEGVYAPSSRAGRTHSLPYCVALALVKGKIEYGYFDDDFMPDEKTAAELISKVEVTEDAEMTRKYPDGAPCRIKVTLKGGQILHGERMYPHGDPQDPLSDADIENKVREYMKGFAEDAEAEDIIKRLWALEEESSVTWLVDPLKKRII